VEPLVGEGYEGGAVVGVVGGFDLGEHGVASLAMTWRATSTRS
jgi:hypothetical protein